MKKAQKLQIAKKIIQILFPFISVLGIYLLLFNLKKYFFSFFPLYLALAAFIYFLIIFYSKDKRILYLYFYLIITLLFFPVLISSYYSKNIILLTFPVPLAIFSFYELTKGQVKTIGTAIFLMGYLGVISVNAYQDFTKNPAKQNITQIAPLHLEQMTKEGNSLQLVSDKIYLLEYYTTWCGPCLEKLRAMKPLTAEFPQVKFVIVHGTAMEENGKKLPENFLDQYPGFELWSDPDTSLVLQFSEGSIPLTIIMNGNGKVYDYEVGYLPKESLVWMRTVLTEAERFNQELFK